MFICVTYSSWTNRGYHNKYSKEDGGRNVRATANQHFLVDPKLWQHFVTALHSHISGGILARRWSIWCEAQSPSMAASSIFHSCRIELCQNMLTWILLKGFLKSLLWYFLTQVVDCSQSCSQVNKIFLMILFYQKLENIQANKKSISIIGQYWPSCLLLSSCQLMLAVSHAVQRLRKTPTRADWCSN